MAFRVTITEVKDILDTDINDDNILAGIQAANTVVTQNLANLSLAVPFTSVELKEIERWLAAHFCCINDMREREFQTGEGRASFEGWGWEKGINFTRYGMQVLILDRSGTLNTLGMKKATFRVSPRRGGPNYVNPNRN